MHSQADIHFMRSALELGKRGLGRVAPNPSVGCIIVQDGVIVGRGRTADGGRPHAEAVALKQAGRAANGATAYVTLEPCASPGREGPCAPALVQAGIKRVVVACLDENPDVYKKGIQILEDAGIDVVLGILEQEARAMHSGFFLNLSEKRPFITLKTACSLDGKIALLSGQSKWITGELARKHAHQLRSNHDAILVGVGTALADDPMLSTRLDGVDHNITRIVMDRDLKLPVSSRLVQSAKDLSLIIFHEQDGSDELENAGAMLRKVDCSDLTACMAVLTEMGVTRLLVEGGGQIHTSFLTAGLCDEMLIYRAPTVLGADAVSCFSDMGIEDLTNRYDFEHAKVQKLGVDVLETYKFKNRA